MALYVNGRPINPVVSFLVSAAVIAGLIGMGILLLPVIGGIFLFILLCVAGIAVYGLYYRWRYGDPFVRMQKEMQDQMQKAAMGQGFGGTQAQTHTSEESDLGPNKAKAGIKRVTTVEDAVVVEEVYRKREDK